MPLFRVTKPAPEPVQVDFVRVMVVGTLVWAVAALVAVVLGATGATGWLPTAVCVTGAALGLVGINWAQRHRPRVEPLPTDAAPTDAAPTA